MQYHLDSQHHPLLLSILLAIAIVAVSAGALTTVMHQQAVFDYYGSY
jgi:hypothetical protein